MLEGVDAPDGRADIALVAGVLVLFGGRLAFGGGDGGLTAAMFVALVLATVLAGCAVRWSRRPFRGAVRALVAAIAFLTLAVDPPTPWDGSVWYVLPGTAFAAVSLFRGTRRRPVENGGAPLPASGVAATGTRLIAVLLLVAVLVFVLLMVMLAVALGDEGSAG